MRSLNIKLLSKDSFVALLRHIIFDIGVKKVIYSHKTPSPPQQNLNRVLRGAETRIDIPLSGIKHMICPGGDSVRDVYLRPGEIHYCPSQYWKIPVWDTTHEMSSVVIREKIIRIIYIKYEHTDLPQPIPKANVFYHTSAPINETGLSVIKSLDSLADKSESTNIEVDLLYALLKLVLLDLEKDQPHRLGKGYITWLKVNEYLHENFYYPINRASVANVFKLNPSHLSRLFATEGHEGFNTTLQRLRMIHAATLLVNGNEIIKEVAEQSGYDSVTSFIAAFKKYHGVTPGYYRITRAKSHLNKSS
jgi:AraC-like DNA-binding protein